MAPTPILTEVESDTGDKLLRSFASVAGCGRSRTGSRIGGKVAAKKKKNMKGESEKVWGTTVAAREGKCQSGPEDAGRGLCRQHAVLVSDGTG